VEMNTPTPHTRVICIRHHIETLVHLCSQTDPAIKKNIDIRKNQS